MKRIFSTIGTLVAGLLLFAVLILLLPLILIMVVVMFAIWSYEGLWRRIRKDPKRDLTLSDVTYPDWDEALYEEQFIKAFEKTSNGIARLAKAKRSKTTYEGFEALREKNPPQDIGSRSLCISQTLTSNSAQIKMSLDIGINPNQGKKPILYAESGEDDCCGQFPPIYIEVTKPSLHTKRNFILSTFEDAWAVISLLRGDVRFTHEGGQLWAHIPEHNVWLVQYKPNKSDYGLRAEFNNEPARKYGR